MSPAVYSSLFATRNLLRSHLTDRREFAYNTTADDLRVLQQFDDDDDNDDVDDVAAFDGDAT